MKRNVVCVLICILCSLTVVFSAVGFASADDVDTTALIQAISRAPNVSTWDDYIDVTVLRNNLEYANMLLSDDKVTQTSIDFCAVELNKAIDSLKLHTKSVFIDKATLTLPVGGKTTLKASLSPDNAADPLVWTSSKPEIISVSNGVLTVLKYTAEKVVITAASNGHSAQCTISVTNPFACVKINDTASVYKTRTVQLTAAAYGIDSTAPTTEQVSWEWSSSDESIATVTTTGCVTGKKSGSCTITAYATNGASTYSAGCTVNVNDFIPITAFQPVTISPTNGLTLTVGESTVYSVAILPTNATDKTIKWSSGDSSIASVSAISVSNSVARVAVTAHKEGTTKVYYAACDGSGVSGSVNVTVSPLISSLALSDTTVVVNVGQTKQLAVTVTPANAGNQLLTWSSSDDSVCSVDYKGNLTAKKLGICTISADTTDGSSLQVRCNVRVASRASKVETSVETLELDTGYGYNLEATVTTVDGTTYTSRNEVAWSCANSAIAKISSSGYVTAYQSGTTTLTATAKDGSGVKGTCTVKVTSPVTAISIPAELRFKIGQTQYITPAYTPTYATNKNVTYSSSSPSVAEVDSLGKITAKSVGNAIITCVSQDGGHKATCKVSVVIPVESVAVSSSTLKVNVGEKQTLTTSVLPSNATNKNVTWKSSDSSIATVDSNGLVTALKAGTAVIAATSSDSGASSVCTVTCIQKVVRITLDKSSAVCYVGQVRSLTATVLPADASDKRVIFLSSDTAVAVVDANGVVTAKDMGTALITATSVDGGYKATCEISVTGKIPVSSITFDKTAIAVNVGNTFNINATILPVDASEQRVVYKSSNTAVVTVNYSTGKVEAKGPGTATVTGRTVDGNFLAECKVTVTQLVSSVSLSKTACSVYVGKTDSLVCTVLPENASNKKVTWSSTDTSIVIVSQTGVIKGVSVGSCLITCHSADGGFEASCTVTVKRAVTGVKISREALNIARGEGALISAIVAPSDASVQDVTWSTSNRLVANVSSSGKVTTGIAGTATITCTTLDGAFKATCAVTVYQPVTNLALNAASIKLDAGKYKTLTVTVTPDNATNKGVKWKSSNTKIATVDSKGKVTAISEGTARIIVTSSDNYSSAYCTVTVSQPPEKVNMTPSSVMINVGAKATIKAVVLPVNAYDKTVRWSSSDNSIATVTQTGVVTALKAGRVTVTCSTNFGNCKGVASVICKIPPTSLTLNRKSLSLAIGKSATITPKVLPEEATYKLVTYSSSNPNVAKVSSKGVVTAVSIGSATITVKTNDGGIKATCFVTVPRRVTGVTLNRTVANVYKGLTLTLKASVLPEDATFDNVSWSSSNTSVATVNSNGVVTARTLGAATITVKTAEGGYTKSCIIRVLQPVTSIKLNRSAAAVATNTRFRLTATVTPYDAANKTVRWYSSDTAVATVDSYGNIVAKAPGTAVITAKTVCLGRTATCTVKVYQPVTGVKLSRTAASIYVSRSVTLTANVLPSNATVKTVSWTSSNPSVATVSSLGVVKGISKGSAVITCTTVNGSKIAKCTVNVIQQVTSVSLNIQNRTVNLGKTCILTASVLPTNANNRNVVWSSSDPAIASVSDTGIVTAKSQGKAVITVKTVNCAKTDTCTITVVQPVVAVTLNCKDYTIVNGKNLALTASVLPSDATNKDVTWSSSDTSVVEVSQGTVTTVGIGTATITCTTVDGSFTAECVITVVTEPESVKLSENTLSLKVGENHTLKAQVLPDTTAQTLTWKSSDEAIASVSSTGVITALKEGSVIITAVSINNNVSSECAVIISASDSE